MTLKFKVDSECHLTTDMMLNINRTLIILRIYSELKQTMPGSEFQSVIQKKESRLLSALNRNLNSDAGRRDFLFLCRLQIKKCTDLATVSMTPWSQQESV